MISVLQKDGSPSVTQKTIILPPCSQIGAISEQLRKTIIETSDIYGKYEQSFDRESAYEVLSQRFYSAGFEANNIVRETNNSVEQLKQPRGRRVFDPKTGKYVQLEEENYQQAQAPERQTLVANQMPRQQADVPPVLVYNPRTGQYEPETAVSTQSRQSVKAAPKGRAQKSVGEKMLDNLVNSAVRGVGYNVGRSVSRGILGVFGLK